MKKKSFEKFRQFQKSLEIFFEAPANVRWNLAIHFRWINVARISKILRKKTLIHDRSTLGSENLKVEKMS
jgi:hypothetical protein